MLIKTVTWKKKINNQYYDHPVVYNIRHKEVLLLENQKEGVSSSDEVSVFILISSLILISLRKCNCIM